VVGYIGECERLGIKVLPPSVGGSDMNFTVEGNNIRFGLLAIKNLGRGFIQEILKERQNGPFASFYDFCKRLSGCRECNRRALESLIKCGALDELHGNRREMIENLPHILDELDERQRRDLMGQIGFFDEEADPALKPAEDYPYAERLTMEKEMTGLYLSGHPLKPYAQLYNDSIMRTSELLEDPADGALVNMLGLVTKVRLQTTKQNAQMAYVTLEDLFGGVELIVFPKTLQQYGALLTNGAMVRVRGRVNVREEEEPKILVDTVAQMSGGAAAGMGGAGSNGAAADTTPSAPARRTPPGLYLRVADEAALQKARPVLALFDGFEPVYVRYLNSGEMKRCAKGVAHNKAMNEELVRLLGTENVVYSPARKS
ncbi:MAG: OB-fold nucleic acid binding domain-containing protein, partial [Oscillospiraceae bacterium]|nr:OB-fold nucleic acid binding domain-containing protein [Oscillospiraceae bacterium]